MGLHHKTNVKTILSKFQNGDECRFLVGTPSVGGYGITLTKANTVIYFSNGYDLEKRLQSEDRAHKNRTKESCNLHRYYM